MENHERDPQLYFDLIEIVGSKGKYQRNIFLIFCLSWFVSGMLLVGTSLLYLNPTFDCEGTEEKVKECERQICALDPSEWPKHLRPAMVKSLATQFGPYLCHEKSILNQYRMALYIGAFLGYLIFLFISDNYGRKKSALVAWGVTSFGVLLLSAAQTMWMASLGLVLAGAGCESFLRITMTVVSEVVDYLKRQSYSILLQMVFGFSGVAVGLVYWWIRDWRTVTIAFCLVPCVVCLLLLGLYFEETPKFLITKKGIPKAVESLNRIGRINSASPRVVTAAHIASVDARENGHSQKLKFMVTPYHLLKFKSLRNSLIPCSIVFMCSTYLYYGPVVIVDKLGTNPFISQIVVGLSEFLACPLSFCYIERLPRLKTGKISYALILLFNAVLIFVNPPPQCDGCFLAVLQIFLVFASRFVVSFFSSILFLYCTEIFPLRSRALGFGMISAMGAVASSSGQLIFTQLEDNHINPMILFALFSLIALVLFFFMKETLNQPLQDQIQQIQVLKLKEANAQEQKVIKETDMITSRSDEQTINGGEGLLNDHR